MTSYFYTNGDTISTDEFEGSTKVKGEFDEFLQLKLEGKETKLVKGKLVVVEPAPEPVSTPPEVPRKDQILSELSYIDYVSSTDRTWREFVIKNSKDFAEEAVDRLKDFENQAITLRTELESLNTDKH